MRLATAEELRELDRRTVAGGVPLEALMDRAGLAVAEAVRRLALATGVADLPVRLVVGAGNNGGDACAAAAHLLSWGFRVRVLLAADPARGTAAGRAFLANLPEAVREPRLEAPRWDADDPATAPRGTVFVDGLLGTGTRGAPRGTAAAAIRWLRRAAAVGPVVAIDLPSGLDADTGICGDPHVVADLTICLALPKAGFRAVSALPVCGRVEIADIGLPDAAAPAPEADGWGWIAEPELRRLLPGRPRDAHKGVLGRLLLLAGSRHFPGAAVLAAGGAVRAGAGLVTVWTLPRAAAAVTAAHPEAIVPAIGNDAAETLSPALLPTDAEAVLGACDAVVAGPGLASRPDTVALVERLLAAPLRGLVLDADALNALAGRAARLRDAGPGVVLTPHPGEAARLLDSTAAAVQSDRPAALRALVAATGATVVLKGAGTLVGAPGRGVHQILAGNPGMASGGSGDVLAGLLGGLLAQGMTPFDAARLAVWWHAAAGDLAAWRGAPAAPAAGDLVRYLPAVRRWLAPR